MRAHLLQTAPAGRVRAGFGVRLAVALACTGLVAGACSSAGDTPARLTVTDPGAWDWPTYGHDAQHTFTGRSTLTSTDVVSLAQAWFFPTGDAVTATPTVVDGTVYVGSWDDNFYAIDLRTGALRWKYSLTPQDAVTPYPGEKVRDVGSDGGLVTSSAWFAPGNGTTRPDLVIFGAGYTLYALEAETGALFWRHDYTGRPWEAPQPDQDGTRIFSSPVVAGDKVIFGVDVDGEKDSRGYVVAADLNSGRPLWEFQTDTGPHGQLLDDGCGSVWSSGSVLPAEGLVVFDEADCDFSNPGTAESIFALHIDTGTLAWRFRPDRTDAQCDWDFGASANVGLAPGGKAVFLGVGGKDGTYYSLDPATGALRWKTNVVFGGFSGGFIATAAYDGTTVVGSTALGDYGRFESNGKNQVCDPGNPADVPFQEPTVHAFDAANGSVDWQRTGAASFAATTIAAGMSFNGTALSDAVQVRSVATGALLETVTVPAPTWSGVATVGDAIVFGTGASQQGSPDGVYAFTPGGSSPAVPGERAPAARGPAS